MSNEEFLNYLYNNSDNLNFLFIMEYLFSKYSYESDEYKLPTYLPITTICQDFGISVYVDNLDELNENLYIPLEGYLDCSETITIRISSELSHEKQRYMAFFLLYRYFKFYKQIKNGMNYQVGVRYQSNGNLETYEEKLIPNYEIKGKVISFNSYRRK